MKITGTNQISGAQKAKKASSTGGGDFSKLLGGADEAEETRPASGIKSISSLNILQEVNPDEQKKRQLVDKGNELLDKLENIRDSMLFGELSLSRLQNLQTIVNSIDNANTDPALEDIIEQIKTRAAVELAKLGF